VTQNHSKPWPKMGCLWVISNRNQPQKKVNQCILEMTSNGLTRPMYMENTFKFTHDGAHLIEIIDDKDDPKQKVVILNETIVRVTIVL
jgi:hypothetical protein